MRQYVNTFEAVTASAPQDLCTQYLSSYGFFQVKRIWVMNADTTPVMAQNIALRCRVLNAVTVGSGGTINAPTTMDIGDSAAASSSHQNDTTKATSGSPTIVWEGSCWLYQGCDVIFDSPIPIIYAGDAIAFVFELLSTPTGSPTLSGGIQFEEAG